MARNRRMVGLVFLTFFVISLLTNILGPIVPDIISSFHISLTAAGFLAFAFFIAYGVMSIPAGFMVERFTEKPVMVVVLFLSKFPKVQHTAEERAGSLDMYRTLMRQRVVWMYFVAMFAYVGCEQGAADWMSSFLHEYHGFDPHTTGATAVSWFWGLLTAGCLAGMFRSGPTQSVHSLWESSSDITASFKPESLKVIA